MRANFSFFYGRSYRVFGPMKNSVTNEQRIRKNEELESLCQKPNIVEATEIRAKREMGWESILGENKINYSV